MKRISNVSLLAAVLVVGACSHYSDDLASLDKSMKAKPAVMAAAPQDIAPAAGNTIISTGPLNEYLARDYYDLAKYENDKAFDYKAAKEYTQRAMLASKGTIVQPAKIASYDVPENLVPELTTAREQLVSVLKDNIVPQNPETLAKAQSSFDCWVERAEEASDETHYAGCKGEFEQAMASMTTPAAGQTSTVYDIGFLQTSAVPDEAAEKRITYIADYLNAPQNTSLTVALSAAADQTGAARLNAVKNALIGKGIAPDRILVTGQQQGAIQQAAQLGNVQAVIVGTPVGAENMTTNFVPTTPADLAPSAGIVYEPTPAPQAPKVTAPVKKVQKPKTQESFSTND